MTTVSPFWTRRELRGMSIRTIPTHVHDPLSLSLRLIVVTGKRQRVSKIMAGHLFSRVGRARSYDDSGKNYLRLQINRLLSSEPFPNWNGIRHDRLLINWEKTIMRIEGEINYRNLSLMKSPSFLVNRILRTGTKLENVRNPSLFPSKNNFDQNLSKLNKRPKKIHRSVNKLRRKKKLHKISSISL